MSKPVLLNLLPGIVETNQYKAWKFPGGELHVKLKEEFMQVLTNSSKDLVITTRMNCSDDLIFLCIIVDTISKTWINEIHVMMPYALYQQADRDFGEGECFSLKTITNILNSLPVVSYTIFDAHSDVSPALLKGCKVIDNSEFVKAVINMISAREGQGTDGYYPEDQLVILSPDAGAYKKIFKLADKIGWKGRIETANKYRDTKNGEISGLRLSQEDFQGRDILIIDDICIGGRTFIALAEELYKRNAGSIYLAVSHGIFSNGLLELGRYFTNIFTTNSRRNEYEEMIVFVQRNQTNSNVSDEFKYKSPFQLHVFEVI